MQTKLPRHRKVVVKQAKPRVTARRAVRKATRKEARKVARKVAQCEVSMKLTEKSLSK